MNYYTKYVTIIRAMNIYIFILKDKNQFLIIKNERNKKKEWNDI